MGLYLLSFVAQAIPQSRLLIERNPFPEQLGYVIALAITLLTLPDVIDLGFSVRFGRRARGWFVGAAIAAAFFNLLAYGELWGPPLAWLLYLVSVFTLGYLGVSHALAALISTPGCEMRAVPHLAALLRGTSTDAVVCPGHWNAVDHWEARLGKAA